MWMIFELLLRLYPREHRVEFGEDMRGVLREIVGGRETGLARARMVGTEMLGLVCGAASERFCELAGRMEAPMVAGIVSACVIHVLMYRELVPVRARSFSRLLELFGQCVATALLLGGVVYGQQQAKEDAEILSTVKSIYLANLVALREAKTLEDMKGLKIRTPSAAQSAQIEALGATPIDMPANQIYNNLDRGVIDASMIPMSAAIDFKLIEVAKYFTVNAPLGRSPFMVCMNKARYDKMPADLKKVIDETTGLNLSLKGAMTHDKQNDEAVAAAKKDREIVMLSDAERKRWLDAFKPLVNKSVAEGEKAGLPAKGLIGAYGLSS